ncbi:MAG: hypothetical protein AAF657_11505 [Acidobacteriota bacterium]
MSKRVAVWRSLAGLVVLLFVPSSSVVAQVNCNDGTIYDDGSFEDAYGAAAEADYAHYVMRFDPAVVPTTIESICLCWTRVGGDSTLDHEIQVWDSDGPGGGPGTLIGLLEMQMAESVPTFPSQAFYRYEVAGSPVINGPVYVGPTWDTAMNLDFFFCSDENGPTTQPGFFDLGTSAGIDPPDIPITDAFPEYRNLGTRVVFAGQNPPPPTLTQTAGLIVPGFEVDLADPDGPGTLFSVRNTTDDFRAVEVNYYPFDIRDAPLRTDVLNLGPQTTGPVNVGTNVTNLLVENNFATGLILINEVGGGGGNLQGDYFRVDFTNDFATGDRMVRPEDLCAVQEIRYVNFGGGTQFRVLLDDPPTDGSAAFSYTAYTDGGAMVAEGNFFSSNHLTLIEQDDLVPGQNFGTLLLDFSPSGSGWASAEYSAFGRFSLELNSACVQEAPVATEMTTTVDREAAKATRRQAAEEKDDAPSMNASAARQAQEVSNHPTS